MINRRKFAAMAVVGALTVSTALTGCGQKTVDYDIDGLGDGSDSNNNSSTSGDSGSLASRLGIPEEYEGNIDVGNTGLTKIEIDDDEIQVPETDKMNVVHATVKTMSNEFKQTLCESVFDKSQGIYVYDYDKETKSDIESEIEDYEKYKQQEIENGGDGSWYDSYISELKAKLPDAPDEYDEAGDYSGDSFIGKIGDTEFIMYFSSSEDGEQYFGLYMRGSSLDYKPYDGATDVYYSNGDYADDYDAEESVNECSMSKDEAAQKAEEILASIGISDYVMTSVEDLVWQYQDSSWQTIAAVADGYIVNFARAIDGVATYDGNLWNVNNLEQDDAWVNIPAETYTVYIDDNGIISLNGTDQLESTGDVETNVSLLTWDELLEKANETIPAYYETYTTSYKKIEFNDVRLTYYVTNDPDNEGQFEYIPTWVFSQYDDYEGSAESTYPEQLVVLDARDGSTLDLLDISQKLGCYQTYDEEKDETIEVDGLEMGDEDESDVSDDEVDTVDDESDVSDDAEE